MDPVGDLRLLYRLVEDGTISRTDLQRLLKLRLRLKWMGQEVSARDLLVRHRLIDEAGLASIEAALAEEVLDIDAASTTLAMEDEPLVDEKLATLRRYEVGPPIGSGRNSRVYRAVDRETGESVAIKVFTTGAKEDREAAWRFWEEILCCETVRSPYVARLRDHGNLEGTFYYVMDLIDGPPIDRFVAERRPSLHEIVRLVARVGRGVAAIHEQEILHRHLAPENVLVDAAGNPVVIDLGVAKRMVGRSRIDMTRRGMILGSPRYLSPEQLGATNHRVSKASDVYSLGVLLYELSTGSHPYPEGRSLRPGASGEDSAVARLVEAMRTRGPTSPVEARPGFPKRLTQALLAALSVDPTARQPDATAFADALEAWAGPGEAGAAPPERPGAAPAVESTGAPAADPEPGPPAPAPPRRTTARRARAAQARPGRSSRRPRPGTTSQADVEAARGLGWLVLPAMIVTVLLVGAAALYVGLAGGSDRDPRVEPSGPPGPDRPDGSGGRPADPRQAVREAIEAGRLDDAIARIEALPEGSLREDLRVGLEAWRLATRAGLSPEPAPIASAFAKRFDGGGRGVLLDALAAVLFEPAAAEAMPTDRAPDLDRRLLAAELALDLRPGDPVARERRAILRLALGLAEQAAGDLVIRLDESAGDATGRKRFAVLTAVAWARAGRDAAGIQVLEPFEGSADREILSARALAHWSAGRTAAARAELERARARTRLPYQEHVLGLIEYAEGSREKAADLLVAAAEKIGAGDYDQPTVYFWAARALRETGRDATRWRRELERWHPAFEWEGKPARAYLD